MPLKLLRILEDSINALRTLPSRKDEVLCA